jgi:response regulator of citrate/malate metabolism
MAGDREKAMEVGCEDYDIKPVEMSRLLGKIAVLLKPLAAERTATALVGWEGWIASWLI